MNQRVLFILIFALLVVAGCGLTPNSGGIEIDWVDFIKWEGKEYDGIYSGVLADDSYVGERIGTVKFRVADNVTNPNYKIKNGDAAFHEKGTEIFKVKGHPNLLAIESEHSINGYQVYFSRDDMEYQWHFKDMPLEKVKRIEIYQSYAPEGNNRISEVVKNEEVTSFLQLLMNSETNPDFQPNTERGDPLYYEMVFYTEETIAYKFSMQFDGHTHFWHPWDTSVLSDDIEMYIREH